MSDVDQTTDTAGRERRAAAIRDVIADARYPADGDYMPDERVFDLFTKNLAAANAIIAALESAGYQITDATSPAAGSDLPDVIDGYTLTTELVADKIVPKTIELAGRVFTFRAYLNALAAAESAEASGEGRA